MGSEIFITKHGRPVARLVPVAGPMPSAYGALHGSSRQIGDVIGPDPEVWGNTDPLDG